MARPLERLIVRLDELGELGPQVEGFAEEAGITAQELAAAVLRYGLQDLLISKSKAVAVRVVRNLAGKDS